MLAGELSIAKCEMPCFSRDVSECFFSDLRAIVMQTSRCGVGRSNVQGSLFTCIQRMNSYSNRQVCTKDF